MTAKGRKRRRVGRCSRLAYHLGVRVVSFGSLNLDLSIRVPHLAAPDETVLATDLAEFVGGKGLNQAVAAARLGAQVSMVGLVGHDAYSAILLAGLDRNGVEHGHVGRAGVTSGLALCHVAEDGASAIVVVPGANALVGVEHADAAGELLASADVLLLQGEVPVAASRRAAELARRGGAIIVVNPAPVGPGSRQLVDLASIVVVNQVEAEALGLEVGGRSTSDRVVLTLGARGAFAGGKHVPAYFTADVVDPTGAGDAFVAALAVSLGEGCALHEAAARGCAAGSAAVRVAGAEPSFPTRHQLESLLSDRS